ncbi:protease Do-like 14 isoform B [Micractinium conductrix]|uniref:Protease Do-like 14 isoform B n=1 Tax=Micractinium conductrix TaxID=554055 RepID=A0A2P6VL85_9CHLO|nr:protease Do-like 14 isoform B [Micractinium conductrix]|eukprot:PSC74849.1 protease Do-like 14 isoform B [Micractinium conductrix]
MALLAGGVALGAQADHMARQQAEQQAAAAGPGAAHAAASGRFGEALQQTQRWLADCLPATFLSHSQARGGGTAGAGGTAVDLRAAGTAPLGGCLSPYYISDAAAKAAPAVVNITVQASGVLPVGSSGSGFIVESDGTILTNAHVVSDAIQRHYFGAGSNSTGGGGPLGPGKGITVTLQDGRIFEGRLVSYDTVSDLAVLKVESDAPLPTARLGRSSSLRVGEWVVALGSPLHLQNSVTAGIVSCVDRKAVELGLAGARTDYIQTDAAINKGNSGGPLVNLFGEVVGISAMKAVAADGVSFAIPVDAAVDVMRQLREHGRVIRPYVGIKMLQLNKHNAAQFRKRDANFPRVDAGILVPGVHPGSPAERAGLRAGDVIVGFAGRSRDVTTTALIKALGEHIGKPLALKVARPGDVIETVTVVALEAVDGHH